MKTFTIENETNHITAHPTLQAAESVAGAERFATAAALGALAVHWPAARLVAIWNSLPGAIAVTKFQDRKTAVARIWNAIQNLGEAAGIQDSRSPRSELGKAKPSGKTTASPAKSKTAPKTKGTRPGSKTEKILDLLKRPGGASMQEIMRATDWQAHSVRGFLSGTLGKKMSLTIVSIRTADGERNYSIRA